MIHQGRVGVVLPAYNAAKTLERTHREIPLDVLDREGEMDDSAWSRGVSGEGPSVWR